MSASGQQPGALMFGYTRVGTDELTLSRNGLEAQRVTIDSEAERRGWNVEYHTDAE